MEVLGAVASGVTLAALFKYSFEALDLIELYQSHGVDFNHLQLQYDLEKCRLYNWGVQMGLADDSKDNLLSEWHSKELVAKALRQVIARFSDAQVIRKRYGCDETTSSAAPALPTPECSNAIASAFGHSNSESSNSNKRIPRMKKTVWIIRDRKKFLALVSDVRNLIDGLEKITSDLSSSARLEEILRIRVNGISNVDTLLGIASVWKESHPRVASAASTKADSISTTSGKFEFIFEWQNSVDSEAFGDITIADVEDLTITELKHSVILFNLQREMNLKTFEALSMMHRSICNLRTVSQELELLLQSFKHMREIRALKNDTGRKDFELKLVKITHRGNYTCDNRVIVGLSFSTPEWISEDILYKLNGLTMLLAFLCVLIEFMEVASVLSGDFCGLSSWQNQKCSYATMLLLACTFILIIIYLSASYLWARQRH